MIFEIIADLYLIFATLFMRLRGKPFKIHIRMRSWAHHARILYFEFADIAHVRQTKGVVSVHLGWVIYMQNFVVDCLVWFSL
jgi:hypothetical protein